MTFKSYSELEKLPTFLERFAYLVLPGIVGERTFGHERYMNQQFYNSAAWKKARDIVQIRDEGCDLGIPGHEIHDTVYIHHINPLTPDDFKFGRPCLVDPDNLITVCHRTHNAIHYGDESQLFTGIVERTAGDTKDW